MAVDNIARMMALDAAQQGGGTTDAYTKAETNELLDGKADLVDGKIPAAQLPSYVDDVAEYASTSSFPATGESGKIYVASDTNRTYRWGGSEYVEISESLALGETASTAYPGNKGKANADAIAAIKDGTNIDSFADVETALSEKLNTSDVDTALSSASANPVQNKAVYEEVKKKASLEDILGVGAAIANNANMNSLTDIGKWYCVNGTTAATVTNAPFNDAAYFGWTIRSVASSDRYVQIAIKNSDTFEIAKRRYSGTWSAWSYLASTAVT